MTMPIARRAPLPSSTRAVVARRRRRGAAGRPRAGPRAGLGGRASAPHRRRGDPQRPVTVDDHADAGRDTACRARSCITSARDGTGRLFIVEQTGTIRVVDDGHRARRRRSSTSAAASSNGGEQGLLGLAFHPRFETNRKFYVNYTNTAGDTVIREYRTSAVEPEPRGPGLRPRRSSRSTSRTPTTTAACSPSGPTATCTSAWATAAAAATPGNRAQDPDTLLGKMLRINVNGIVRRARTTASRRSNPYVGRSGRDEIWQRGLRNPWRFSFDRATGDLWIGDVGQDRYEEIDRAVRSRPAGRGDNSAGA